MTCSKCGSTINVKTREVLEFHEVMCDKWASEKELN